MRKLIFASMLLVPLVIAAGVAEATPTPFEDIVVLGQDVEPGPSLIYNHDITAYLPAVYIMHEATLNLQLVDDTDDELEMSLVIGEGLTTSFGYPEVGEFEVIVAALSDGLMYVTVTSLDGDFHAVDSTLAGSFTTVPEPATMVLFIMGGIATAVTRKKFRKKK